MCSFALEQINFFFFFSSYEGRKDLFEQKELIDYIRAKKRYEEQLREELKTALKSAGYRSDDESDGDSDEDVKYIHLLSEFSF